MCIHSQIIAIYIYGKRGSTCKEAAILHHSVPTVTQNVAQGFSDSTLTSHLT